MNRLLTVAVVCVAAVTLYGQDHSSKDVDVLHAVPDCDVTLNGWLGMRVERNAHEILLNKDEDALLDSFRKREIGDKTWLGEHVGKWLSAASQSYDHLRDERLLAKMKRVVNALLATQMADGYLGTYTKSNRWTGWDVWVHKYNMLGLLDYYAVTDDTAALDGCRRMADLLTETFGLEKLDIIKSGENTGMAATSVLEPIVRLYNITDEQRYLAFAKYIVTAIEQPNGPRIISGLQEQADVTKVANAKGYEMVSTIIGLVELYRVTHDEQLLKTARLAADDIIANQLYITGGSTFHERWQSPTRRPNAGYVAETCVSMSLLSFYQAMFEVTSDTKYADAAEVLIYNHVLACQHPDGRNICYYTPLWGHKLYQNFLGCCISSGPRVISTIPGMAYFVRDNQLMINLLETSRVKTQLPDGRQVEVNVKTDYPFDGHVTIHAKAANKGTYTLAVRIPSCVDGAGIEAGSYEKQVGVDGLHLELDLKLKMRVHRPSGPLDGLFALQRGPVVYACDAKDNHAIPPGTLPVVKPDARPEGRSLVLDNQITLTPFADAGADETFFSVFLRDPKTPKNRWYSLFSQIDESSSRTGTHHGSIVDNDPTTYMSTDDGNHRDEDWFQIGAGWHNKYTLIVFRHGRNSPDGGWFDTSQGKPRVLVKTWHGFEQIGVLDDYPETTADDPGTLQDGDAIRFVIPKDKRRADFTIRIVGRPASGNDTAKNHVTCSEIAVFYEPER